MQNTKCKIKGSATQLYNSEDSEMSDNEAIK